MADTTYTDFSTVVQANWLNDANRLVYRLCGLGGTPPTTTSDIRTNLGFTSGYGASYIGYQPTISFPVRTVSSKLLETKSVKDFGLLADGSVDETVKLQAAVSYLDSQGGGVLTIPCKGVINISAGILSTQGVLIRAESPTVNDDSSNTNGSGSSSVRIVWVGGVSTAHMYQIRSSTAGNVVWGGGSIGIEWDGGGKINGAVHLNNTKFSKFYGKIRNVTYAGVLISSLNGVAGNFSQLNEVDLEFVYGASAACDGANGVVLQGNGSTVPATQQQIYKVTGLVKNGYGLVVSDTDNCKIGYVNVSNAGTGGAIQFNNSGTGNANVNLIEYVAGKIDWGSGLYGNRVLHYIGEAGGFSGSSSYHTTMFDYLTGRRYESHSFQLRKWLDFKIGDFLAGSGTSVVDVASKYLGVGLPDASTTKVTASLTADYDLANGSIEGIEIFYSTNDTVGGNVRFNVDMSSVSVGNTLNVATHSYPSTNPLGGQYVLQKYAYTIAPAVDFAVGDTITLSISRLGADALDTSTGTVVILGVRLNYKSKGPDSAGSGTYYIPSWN